VFQPTVTRAPFTPLPPAPIIGTHTVLGGETIFCIGRGYGVLPAAISQANGLSTTANVRAGQQLAIPEVRWFNIAPGPVCAPQFASPFPGLTVATATSPATSTPAGLPLAVVIAKDCVGDNCGSRDGYFTLRVEAIATGGVKPYQYFPSQVQIFDVQHCTFSSGSVTVISADAQEVTAPWTHEDPSCR
jgi:LysM repeat protein